MKHVKSFSKLGKNLVVMATVVSMTVMTGCATRNAKMTSYQKTHPVATYKPVPGAVAVAIRWPVAVDARAQEMMTNNKSAMMDILRANDAGFTVSSGILMLYGGMYWWLVKPMTMMNAIQSNQIAESSTYHAMELYSTLSKYLPESEIILEPMVLTTNNGSLQFKPLLENKKLPTVFKVDYMASPHNVATASVISVSTGGLASPKTCGAVAGLDKHTEVPQFRESECAKLSSRTARAPDFMEYFYSDKAPNHTAIPVKDEPPFTPNVLTTFEFQHYGEEKRSSENMPINEIHAKAIAEGLNQYDVKKALAAGFAEYATEYDSALAERLFSGANLSKQEQQKLTVITKLAEMEKAWVSKQDKTLANNIYNGPFGKSFKETEAAQHALAEQEQARMGAAIGSAMASASAMGAAALTNDIAGNIAGSLLSASQMMTTLTNAHAATKNLEHDFYAAFGAEMNAKDRVFEFIIADKMQTVNAKNRKELRDNLKKLYQKSFAALNSRTTRKK